MLKILTQNIYFSIFVKTQKTPNPNFLKFLPVSKLVLPNQDPIDISSEDQAIKISPLAKRIFKIKGITRVFYGHDFISISKAQHLDWNQIKPIIFDLIDQHFQSQQQLLIDQSTIDYGFDPNDTETIKQIKEILTTRVRPTVQEDGGDVKFSSFDQKSGILKLLMLGSCSGCPSSAQTLKNGIQKMMRHYIPSVKSVEGIQKS